VRRGPGGGYYGKRPDEAALERSVAAYIRVHPAALKEVSEIVSLLDCELIPAAARCTDEALRQTLRGLAGRVDACDTAEARIALEQELHNTLYQMVNRPLIELLTRVTTQLQRSPPANSEAAWPMRSVDQALGLRVERLAADRGLTADALGISHAPTSPRGQLRRSRTKRPAQLKPKHALEVRAHIAAAPRALCGRRAWSRADVRRPR
jgi:hypothetical protein